MNKPIIIITFAMLIGSITNVAANDLKTKSILTQNENAEFGFYLEKQVPMFYQLNTQHWKTFKSVVAKFNTSTANLLNTTNEERTSFLIASKEMKNELTITKNKNSEKWIKAINQTEAIIKFTWELQQPINVEFEKVPVMKNTPSLGTNFLGE